MRPRGPIPVVPLGRNVVNKVHSDLPLGWKLLVAYERHSRGIPRRNRVCAGMRQSFLASFSHRRFFNAWWARPFFRRRGVDDELVGGGWAPSRIGQCALFSMCGNVNQEAQLVSQTRTCRHSQSQSSTSRFILWRSRVAPETSLLFRQ